MEVELKYLTDRETAKTILDELSEGEIEPVSKVMKSVYFDTKDGGIRDIKAALRVRQEGEEFFATLKFGNSKKARSASGGEGKARGEATENGATAALHRRAEYNYEVGEDFMESPRIDIFDESSIYERLDHAVGGQYSDDMGEMRPVKKLLPFIRTDFIRTEIGVRFGDSDQNYAILSYDEGEIIAGGNAAPISEIEIELVKGDERELILFGESLREKYGLSDGPKSKYARGLKLIQKTQKSENF